MVSAISRVPDRQYYMPEQKLRACVDAVLPSANSAGIRNVFVNMISSLWRRKDELMERLFQSPVEKRR